ncbi:MAG TPA: hypothetical protein VFQ77_03625, partial [Pseudonocardiaceae bacterium]|nr:hypothetical protein [Pseudonocardiaceae bacterium]
MSDLIGTGNITGEPAARWAWVRWAHSARDGQVHAFPIEDSQRGRWLQAVCSHTAPPAALGSSLPTPYCLTCLRS